MTLMSYNMHKYIDLFKIFHHATSYILVNMIINYLWIFIDSFIFKRKYISANGCDSVCNRCWTCRYKHQFSMVFKKTENVPASRFFLFLYFFSFQNLSFTYEEVSVKRRLLFHFEVSSSCHRPIFEPHAFQSRFFFLRKPGYFCVCA